MELKDFIKGTITAITKSISELNSELSDTGLIIAPSSGRILNEGKDNITRLIGIKNGRESGVIYEIEFNLSLSETEERNTGGGVNIKVLSMDGKNKTGTEAQNTVKFSIPVVYPSPKA